MIMDRSITDAEAVAEFRQKIWETAEELHKTLQETEKEIESLSQTWRDGEFKKFAEKFEEDKGKIRPLCTQMREFESENLMRKEAAVRKYRNTEGARAFNYSFN